MHTFYRKPVRSALLIAR